MKKNWTVYLIVYILYQKTVFGINQSITAQIFINLSQRAKSLRNIDAYLGKNVRMIFNDFPRKLYFLIS